MSGARVVKGILAFLLLSLTGCERQWGVDINEKGKSIFFCFKTYGTFFSSTGLQLFDISVDQVNTNRNVINHMWSTHNNTYRDINYKINCVTYGVSPAGWSDDIAPRKIENGAIYSINNHIFFERVSEDHYFISSDPLFGKYK